MLSLPIGAQTFKRSFLGGSGSLEIQTDLDAWKDLFTANEPFTKDVDQLAELQVGVQGSTTRIGQSGGLSLSLSGGFEARNQIFLIWPDDEEGLNLLRNYGLEVTDGQVYAVLRLEAAGSGSASGQFQAPAGVKMNFGVSAGASAAFECFRRFPDSQGARDVLKSLFEEVRFPQQIDSVEEIPGTGDLYAVRLAGHLKLNAGISWGYSISGSRSLEIRDLAMDLDFAFKAAASLSFGYSLAGDFEIQALSGSEEGWVRFVVRKSRDSHFNFAANIGVDAEVRVKGLPDSADDFISKLAGDDASSVLKALKKARELSSLEALEKEVNRLAWAHLEDLSEKWLDKALNTEVAQEFFAIASRIVQEVENLDQRVVDFYQKLAAKTPIGEIRQAVDKVAGLNSPDALKDLINRNEISQNVWEAIEAVSGDSLLKLLVNLEEFQQFHEFIAKVQDLLDPTDEIKRQVRDFLDSTIPQVGEIVAKLKQIDTPQELKDLAQNRLKGWAEKLIGRAFDSLDDTGFEQALNELKKVLDKIEGFKEKWYKQVLEATHQKFQFDLAYAYARTKSSKSLLDVEINLEHPDGPQLARDASGGDFVSLLSGYTSKAVIIHEGIFTSNLQKSGRLQINVFGWGFDRLAQVIQNSEHALETHGDGLLHVYTTKTEFDLRKKSGRRFKESVATKFLVKSIAESFQPEDDPAKAIDPARGKFLARTLKQMTVDYDLTYEDERTKADELFEYLRFGRQIGLLKDPWAFAHELDAEFPSGLGKVSVSYTVGYNHAALVGIFQRRTEELQRDARKFMRQLISAKYIGLKRTNWAVRVGFAYESDDTAEKFKNPNLQRLSVTVPPSFPWKGSRTLSLRSSQIAVMWRLYEIEAKYIKRLGELDKAVDQARDQRLAIRTDQLDRVWRRFVEMSGAISEWDVNAFFGIFDALAHPSGTAHRGKRESALIIEITPQGAEKAVRKVIMAPSGGEGV